MAGGVSIPDPDYGPDPANDPSGYHRSTVPHDRPCPLVTPVDQDGLTDAAR